MLSGFPKKSLCVVILLASTALTACGGGGGGGGNHFSITSDRQMGTLPEIRPFTPDQTVPDFDASATEYQDTPTLMAMGLTPFYAAGVSGSGISVGVLEAGAVGYIPKNIGIKAFFSALTLMIEGQIFMPQESSHHNNEKHFLPINDLTGRELDMLSGLLAGKSDKEIAIKYGIALVTVKHHLKSLRGKLGAKNRTHAVCRAIELGLTQEASET